MKLKVSLLVFAFLAISCAKKDNLPNGWTQALINSQSESCVSVIGGTQSQCDCYSRGIADKYTPSQVSGGQTDSNVLNNIFNGCN